MAIRLTQTADEIGWALRQQIAALIDYLKGGQDG